MALRRAGAVRTPAEALVACLAVGPRTWLDDVAGRAFLAAREARVGSHLVPAGVTIAAALDAWLGVAWVGWPAFASRGSAPCGTTAPAGEPALLPPCRPARAGDKTGAMRVLNVLGEHGTLQPREGPPVLFAADTPAVAAVFPEGFLATVIPVFEAESWPAPEARVVDLVVLDPARPERWALATGRARALGWEALTRRHKSRGRALVARDPLSWLRDGARAWCPLVALESLSPAVVEDVAEVIGQDQAHARALHAWIAAPRRVHRPKVRVRVQALGGGAGADARPPVATLAEPAREVA